MNIKKSSLTSILVASALAANSSVAFGASRVEQINLTSTAIAKTQIDQLKIDVTQLDATLEKIAGEIAANKGMGISGGIVVTAAGVALAGTTLAYLSLQSRRHGAAVGGLVFGAIAYVPGLIALGTSGYQQIQSDKVDVVKTKQELDLLEVNLEQVKNSSSLSLAESAVVNQTTSQIQSLRTALANYESKQDEKSYLQVAAMTAQVLGGVAAVAGASTLVPQAFQSKTISIGALVATVGNIGLIIAQLGDGQADVALERIAQARSQISTLVSVIK